MQHQAHAFGIVQHATQIHACTERLALAAQHQHARGGIGGHALQRGLEGVDQVQRKRVARIGAMQAERENTIGGLQVHQVGHARSVAAFQPFRRAFHALRSMVREASEPTVERLASSAALARVGSME